MKIHMKGRDADTGGKPEEVRIEHDSCFGFVIYISRGQLHIRAKAQGEVDYLKTTIHIDPIAETVI